MCIFAMGHKKNMIRLCQKMVEKGTLIQLESEKRPIASLPCSTPEMSHEWKNRTFYLLRVT